MPQNALKEYKGSSRQKGFVDHWNEVLSTQFSGKSITPDDPSNFSALIKSLQGETGTIIAEAWSTAAEIRHEQHHVTQQDAREFILHYQVSGSCLNQQAGREAILQPGEFTFCDTARPYSVEFKDPARVLVLRLEQTRLQQQFGSLDDLVAVPVSSKNAGAQLFSSFIETFWGRATHGAWHAVDHALEDAMISLLLLAYRPVIATQYSDRSLCALRWKEAARFVEENLTDHKLSLAAVADHLRMSTRYVQSLFAQHGETLTSYIQSRRLELGARLLLNPEYIGQGVMGVCLDSGFTDLSYFTRQFKARFGETPARYRLSRLS
ncbi:MAG: helix-turn-helix domain-containing protein [Sphingomonadaceae bacterium]|nr:helix-turn-helix domain-containing protein [Sphingomonadaceae bacterium]